MSAILDQVFDRSRTSVTEAAARAVDSTASRNYQRDESEDRFFDGSGRQDFGHTLTPTSGPSRGPATTGFAAFVNQFDGLRIPSSPLHEF